MRNAGYEFSSETDSEVVANLVDSCFQGDLFAAVRQAVGELEGAFRDTVAVRRNRRHAVRAALS